MAPAVRLTSRDIKDVDALFGVVEFLRLDANRRLAPDRRVELGQFLTPAPISRLMASMFSVGPQELRILDAGAGIGSLLAAVVARACTDSEPPKRIVVTAYEVDPILSQYLGDTLEACRELSHHHGIDFEGHVREEDFLKSVAESSQETLFSNSGPTPFNRVILNPPYRKINTTSATYRLLQAIDAGTTNLYTAFVSLAVRVLEREGELVAITPRSFCNGTYFRAFREAFLETMTLRRLHVFESRNLAFQDDDVLQENIIFHAAKRGRRQVVTISASEGPGDDAVSLRRVLYEEVVNSGDADAFIRLTPDQVASDVANAMGSFGSTLEGLGVSVSTGRVVDFRAKSHLCRSGVPGTAPLIYPGNFKAGFVSWPVPGKKFDAIAVEDATRDLLIPAGAYVLVKRFTSKEEKRRVVAAVYDPQRIRAESVGFENHLNYFHAKGRGIPMTLARGMAAFLNSTLVDSYFRQFSGHTQVNAGDLRNMKYPSRSKLESLGARIGNDFADQQVVDELVAEELMPATETPGTPDPIQARKRVSEALAILKALGLPRPQQNERSALTLLALLELGPQTPWAKAGHPMLGITQMMKYFERFFGKVYAPNTRETVRRQTIHQFVQAGLALLNPDKPDRPTNSPDAVYQIEKNALRLLRSYGKPEWKQLLQTYLGSVGSLAQRYADERELLRIPVKLAGGKVVSISPGGQNELIRLIISEFCERFTPGGTVLYVGDTADKLAHFDKAGFEALGVSIEKHGKLPDVVVYLADRGWLVLIEAFTSHGPVNPKRKEELELLFKGTIASLVFVTAFLTRKAMQQNLGDIAWETEVWLAESPSHLIHFNGKRILGPNRDA